MALEIITPAASFVRFDNESGVVDHCIFDNIRFCLPVFAYDDVAFQFSIIGTKPEIDELCGAYGIPILVGMIKECGDVDFLHQFEDLPNIFRLSDGMLLINWANGLPGFDGVVDINECFKLRVQIGVLKFCSNCFVRIADDCFTSVIDYGNDENAFDFNYCSGNTGEDGTGSGDNGTCLPTLIPFTNRTILTIPYTTALRDLYGDVPDVKVWIFDTDGTLISPLISITFDAYPPTIITIDLGGLSSGVVMIK